MMQVNIQKQYVFLSSWQPSYRGKPQGEKLFYMYAQSLYKTKQYYLAGYQYDSFNSGYPKSEKS